MRAIMHAELLKPASLVREEEKRSSICCNPVKYGKREPLSILQETDASRRKLECQED